MLDFDRGRIHGSRIMWSTDIQQQKTNSNRFVDQGWSVIWSAFWGLPELKLEMVNLDMSFKPREQQNKRTTSVNCHSDSACGQAAST